MSNEEKNPITHGDIKKHFKPRLKPLSKNKLIDIIIQLSAQVVELKDTTKGSKDEK